MNIENSGQKMTDLDFYNDLTNPLSGMQDDTVSVLMDLFHRVEKLEAEKPIVKDCLIAEKPCPKCDVAGGSETFENQVNMPINGKVQSIDWCIHTIVAALNAGGVETTASCCGHKKQDGRIDLLDGRVLIVKNKSEGVE